MAAVAASNSVIPTALVTGASSGIGLGIAKQLLKDGFRVAANSRSIERLTKAFATDITDQERARLVLLEADAASTAGIEKLVADVKKAFSDKLSVLVNNAGNASFDLSFGSATWSDANFDATFNTFVRGPALLLNRLVPLLAEAAKESGRTSSVVNISSFFGTRIATNGFVPYSATKAAMDAISKGAAAELAPLRIRVSSVAPGMTLTNFLTEGGMQQPAIDGFVKYQAEKNIPLGRPGMPEDMAKAVSFLADDSRSNWITGIVLTVDGGQSIKSVLA